MGFASVMFELLQSFTKTGGWPTLGLIDSCSTRMWVPHPARFSQGGQENASANSFQA